MFFRIKFSLISFEFELTQNLCFKQIAEIISKGCLFTMQKPIFSQHDIGVVKYFKQRV